jgi:hypothetical protein
MGDAWKRFVGISEAKARMSRKIGIPLTRSGGHQKIGRGVTGGGCLLPLAGIVLASPRSEPGGTDWDLECAWMIPTPRMD